jgi:hypothetical protein
MGGLRKQLHQRQLGVVQVAVVAVGDTPKPAVAVAPPVVVDRVAVHEKADEQRKSLIETYLPMYPRSLCENKMAWV